MNIENRIEQAEELELRYKLMDIFEYYESDNNQIYHHDITIIQGVKQVHHWNCQDPDIPGSRDEDYYTEEPTYKIYLKKTLVYQENEYGSIGAFRDEDKWLGEIEDLYKPIKKENDRREKEHLKRKELELKQAERNRLKEEKDRKRRYGL